MRPPGILILPAKGRLGDDLPMRSNCNSPLACISWMFEMRFHSPNPIPDKKTHGNCIGSDGGGPLSLAVRLGKSEGNALCRVPSVI